jgi:hypothetical protein
MGTELAGVRFYPLPATRKKNKKAIRAANRRKKQWLDLIRREKFLPDRMTRVCSRHFPEGKSPAESPDTALPTLFPYNNWGEYKLFHHEF